MTFQKIILAVIGSLCLGNPIYAATSKTTVTSNSASSYTWHDDRGAHSVQLMPDLIAEFGYTRESNVKNIVPNAQTIKASSGAIRIWQISGETGAQAMQKTRAAYPAGKYSPVFRDGGRLRALPGNIIVRFKSEWTETTCNNWLETQQLTLVNKLNAGNNTYVIKAEPGLAALTLANRIHQSGDVVFAHPNWWTEVGKK